MPSSPPRAVFYYFEPKGFAKRKVTWLEKLGFTLATLQSIGPGQEVYYAFNTSTPPHFAGVRMLIFPLTQFLLQLLIWMIDPHFGPLTPWSVFRVGPGRHIRKNVA